MTSRVRILVCACVTLSLGALSNAQPSAPRLTETDARAFAEQAAKQSNNKRGDFDKAFKALVRTRLPKYEDGPVPMQVYWYGLRVMAAGQVAAFQERVWEQIRTVHPVSDAVWSDGPVVSVETTDAEAATYDRVIIRRGVESIEPTRNDLKTADKNIDGDMTKVRDGFLTYSFSAFAARTKGMGDVKLILIPESGSKKNIELTLTDATLRRIYEN